MLDAEAAAKRIGALLTVLRESKRLLFGKSAEAKARPGWLGFSNNELGNLGNALAVTLSVIN